MKIENDVKLSKYTTFKMGGIAKEFIIPENIEDVIELSKNYENIQYILGGGSNLLINDSKIFSRVVYLKEFNNVIKNLENGKYYVGASVSLQKLILNINKDEYGGIEYLFSVPGLVGGAVYMNAGRGKSLNNNISDYIESVEYIKDGKLLKIDKKDCNFKYRFSIFQEMNNCILVGATFKFEKSNIDELEARRKERISLCKKRQDMSNPNFGSVFRECNSKIMKFIRFINKFQFKNKVHFSSKTTNWLLNGKSGTFMQAQKCIRFVEKIHKIFRKKCSVEVKIWE